MEGTSRAFETEPACDVASFNRIVRFDAINLQGLGSPIFSLVLVAQTGKSTDHRRFLGVT